MAAGEILLVESMFDTTEKTLLSSGSLQASTFRYPTGVCAVRVRNPAGYVVILPFQGQQVWDAYFNNRRLTMRSMFSQPRMVTSFLETYGCFIMHCGARRMGCPGPQDDHPLHGELPYAHYDSAFVGFGRDQSGEYLCVGGSYEYNKAFGDNYEAKPEARIYANTSVLSVDMEIKNKSNYSMDLMYMCHVNFLPVPGSLILQSADWDPETMKIRESMPQHLRLPSGFLDFVKKLGRDPSLTRVIREEDQYDPEISFAFRRLRPAADGKVRFIQKHPDNSGDYMCYSPFKLDHTTRWIIRNLNQEALGLALPGTCEAEGYTEEKKKGNVKTLPPHEATCFHIDAGYLSPDEMSQMIDLIPQTVNGG